MDLTKFEVHKMIIRNFITNMTEYQVIPETTIY